jgi:hypothetical protein
VACDVNAISIFSQCDLGTAYFCFDCSCTFSASLSCDRVSLLAHPKNGVYLETESAELSRMDIVSYSYKFIEFVPFRALGPARERRDQLAIMYEGSIVLYEGTPPATDGQTKIAEHFVLGDANDEDAFGDKTVEFEIPSDGTYFVAFYVESTNTNPMAMEVKGVGESSDG